MDFIQQNRTLFIVEGILFLLLGILAIALPGIMTLGIELLIGWLFLIGGIIQGYRVLTMREAPGFWPALLSAIVSLIVGWLLLYNPIKGVITLTILLIAYFIIDGIAKMILSFELKAVRGWGWLLFSGIISLLMAAILISGWPGTAAWAIGLLVGINMLFLGSSLLTLGFNSKK